MTRKGRTKVIYKGTFISDRSLCNKPLTLGSLCSFALQRPYLSLSWKIGLGAKVVIFVATTPILLEIKD